FNTGTGNFGLFNSGSYNTGIGNGGTGSTGLFNAGSFNTGLANAGSYNTGSFNAGDTNTGGFNPGSINTGWLNTGHANTGVANAGNVNTGAFVTGNFSNGILWRGDYQGLAGFAVGYTLPPFPAVGADVSGGIGPITVLPPIHIPSIPVGFAATGGIGPITIPDITVPAIHLGIAPTVNVGTITVDPITVTTPAVQVRISQSDVISTSGPSSAIWLSSTLIPNIQISPESNGGGTSTQLGFVVGPIDIPAATLNFPGFTIPLDPIDIGLPVSLTIPGFTIPGGTLIPTLPLGLALSNGIPPVDIPAIVLDRILLDLHADTTIGPINVPIAGFGGAPGFGNSTTLPSSGFFNTGAGGGSGFSNTGAGMSGLLNAMSDPLLGSASG
ncbi:PPE family protein, partial [Mycobacterium canettii]